MNDMNKKIIKTGLPIATAIGTTGGLINHSFLDGFVGGIAAFVTIFIFLWFRDKMLNSKQA